MAAKIHIERMMHRNSIAVAGESAASYALIKLIPTGLGGGPSRWASTSPWCSTSPARCTRRTAPASAASSASRTPPSPPSTSSSRTTRSPSSPSPTTPRSLLPPTPLSEKAKIEDVIRKIDMFDVDPGGTAMDEGMQLALDEVEKLAGAGQLSQVVVLTDGETSGEQDCRAARAAGRREEDPPHAHGRRHRLEGEPHQGPGQAQRGQVVLHRRQPGRRGRAHLRRGVRAAGRHRRSSTSRCTCGR